MLPWLGLNRFGVVWNLNRPSHANIFQSISIWPCLCLCRAPLAHVLSPASWGAAESPKKEPGHGETRVAAAQNLGVRRT